MNIETAAGDARNVFPTTGQNPSVVHTNHFRHDIDGGNDLAPSQMADSYLRLERLENLISTTAHHLTREDIQQALADHEGYPSSVCCHPDHDDALAERWQTLAGIIMEPAIGVMHLTEGNPCDEAWTTLDYSDVLRIA